MSDRRTQIIESMELRVDNAFKKSRFFKIAGGQARARWYSLLVHEDRFRLSERSSDRILVENFRGGLEEAFKFVATLPPKPFLPRKEPYPKIYKAAADFLQLSIAYWKIIPPFTLFRRGIYDAEIVNEQTVRFHYKDPRRLAFEVLDRTGGQERDSAVIKSSSLEGDLASAVSALTQDRQLAQSIKATGKSIAYDYDLARKHVNEVSRLFKSLESSKSLFPTTWRIQYEDILLTGHDIISFLGALQGISLVHQRIHLPPLPASQWAGAGSALPLMNSDEAVRRIADAGELEVSKAAALGRLLTAGMDSSCRDFSLKPIASLGYRQLTWSPEFLLSSDLQRNILANLAKFNTSAFDRESHKFELSMTSQVAMCIPERFTAVLNRKYKIGEYRGEIDLALHCPESKLVVLVELKWVIPPSEPNEIKERVKREKEGLCQVQRALNAWRANPAAFLASLFGESNKLEVKETLGMVVIEGFWGSPQMLEASLPVVERNFFEKNLRKSANLNQLKERIFSLNFIPVRDRDWIRDEAEMKFGRDRVLIDGFRLPPFE